MPLAIRGIERQGLPDIDGKVHVVSKRPLRIGERLSM